jgi:methyl-accepting chemotaxis protein
MELQLSVGQKLAWSVAAMLALCLGLGAWARYSNWQLNNELENAIQKTDRKLVLVGDIKAAVLSIRMANRGVLLFSSIDSKETMEKTEKAFNKGVSVLNERIGEMRPLLAGEEGTALLNEIESGAQSYIQNHRNLYAMCQLGKSKEAATTDSGRGVVIGTRMSDTAEKLQELQLQRSREALRRSAVLNRVSNGVTSGLIALSIAVALAILLGLRGTNRTLQQATAELVEEASQVSEAALQVSSTGQSLAQGASEQAASLEETSASSEQIASMAHRNTESSGKCAQLMAVVDRRVSEANASLSEMAASMQEITTAGDRISRIIKVIDGIAFQTNILALNAAVEAARAGEAGLGFAVVADEVRNLAQRSAQAAKDTTELIETSNSKSHEGSSKLTRVTSVIDSITESISQVKILVQEVNLGSQEQMRGVDQIAKAILHMQQLTQDTASKAEESAGAGEELSGQVASVRESVGRLSDLIDSKRSRAGLTT